MQTGGSDQVPSLWHVIRGSLLATYPLLQVYRILSPTWNSTGALEPEPGQSQPALATCGGDLHVTR